MTGRVVFTQELNAVKGYNEVEIDGRVLGVAGVLYYQVRTGEFSATRKMIRLK